MQQLLAAMSIFTSRNFLSGSDQPSFRRSFCSQTKFEKSSVQYHTAPAGFILSGPETLYMCGNAHMRHQLPGLCCLDNFGVISFHVLL